MQPLPSHLKACCSLTARQIPSLLQGLAGEAERACPGAAYQCAAPWPQLWESLRGSDPAWLARGVVAISTEMP